ncbi:hypothetical protein L3X38_042639 [Prunus dulcis]|uniref:UDP-Glycosyltransferase superfamily protein n=1 Tax=Prunus dulcis TaxID=3755 RepID=A0AAD4YM59_PRUDU|nr:hypothetical protein L3X38_042639 [Prunus dulcis]
MLVVESEQRQQWLRKEVAVAATILLFAQVVREVPGRSSRSKQAREGQKRVAQHPCMSQASASLDQSRSSLRSRLGPKTNVQTSLDKTLPPMTCIVSDGVMSFAIKAGEDLGIPVALFWCEIPHRPNGEGVMCLIWHTSHPSSRRPLGSSLALES